MDLIQCIEAGQSEFLLFSLTPPRHDTDRERAQEIAETTIAHLLFVKRDLRRIFDFRQRAVAERLYINRS